MKTTTYETNIETDENGNVTLEERYCFCPYCEQLISDEGGEAIEDGTPIMPKTIIKCPQETDYYSGHTYGCGKKFYLTNGSND